MTSFILSLDAGVLQTLFASRTPELVKLFSVITELGGAVAVIVIALGIAAVLWRQGRWHYIAGLFLAVGGSVATGYILKGLIQRARPPMPYPAVVETSYSFPSNHALVAMALYGFVIYLVWKLCPESIVRGIWIGLLTSLILLIGFSRLYLGVHYMSDVLGGFALGGIFLWLGILLAKKLEKPSTSVSAQGGSASGGENRL